jgi:hypothetical protein
MTTHAGDLLRDRNALAIESSYPADERTAAPLRTRPAP